MSDLKLTPSLLSMLDRIERNSGTLLMLAVTASGQHGKVKCDRPSVTEGAWPAEALAITEAGRAALSKLRRKAPSLARRANHGAEIAEKKGQRRSDDTRVIFRRDGERYIVFLGDDRIGFVPMPIAGLGTTSTRQWRIPVTPKPEKEPVSYCATAMSTWFERA